MQSVEIGFNLYAAETFVLPVTTASLSFLSLATDTLLGHVALSYKHSLTKLNVAGNTGITKTSIIKILTQCKQLQYLDISHCTYVKQDLITSLLEDSAALPTKLHTFYLSFVKNVSYEHILHLLEAWPQLQLCGATHLAQFSQLDLKLFSQLKSKSYASARILYEYALINAMSDAFTDMHGVMNEMPSQELIHQCVVQGNYRITPLLQSLNFAFNSIDPEVVGQALLNDNYQVVAALNQFRYNKYNNIILV